MNTPFGIWLIGLSSALIWLTMAVNIMKVLLGYSIGNFEFEGSQTIVLLVSIPLLAATFGLSFYCFRRSRKAIWAMVAVFLAIAIPALIVMTSQFMMQTNDVAYSDTYYSTVYISWKRALFLGVVWLVGLYYLILSAKRGLLK
ncbi:hypothetical protein [Roseovarius sp. 2305UL8-3]|uniref:hypothetical protein n=1 Tax=Roseovarius conchicola TaxID=3121636 RepID=UPI003529284C